MATKAGCYDGGIIVNNCGFPAVRLSKKNGRESGVINIKLY